MSRLATLPNALKIERITRGKSVGGEAVDVVRPLEGGAFVNVGNAQAIYALGCEVHVELNNFASFCFTMPDETAACEGVERLARAAAAR